MAVSAAHSLSVDLRASPPDNAAVSLAVVDSSSREVAVHLRLMQSVLSQQTTIITLKADTYNYLLHFTATKVIMTPRKPLFYCQ